MFVVFDSENVWGIGSTENEALSDAEKWVHEGDGDFNTLRSSGELILAKANEELVSLIERKGGENTKLRKGEDGQAHLLS